MRCAREGARPRFWRRRCTEGGDWEVSPGDGRPRSRCLGHLEGVRREWNWKDHQQQAKDGVLWERWDG